MTDADLLVTSDGPVRILTFNRPHRRNALGLAQGRELLRALAEADNDPECRCVLLTGNGALFCAGGDLSVMGADPAGLPGRMEEYNDLARSLIQSTKPRVAAVIGGAFGLGLSLAAACDHIVAADDARFVASFIKVGLVPDTGLSWTLPRRVGIAQARRIALFGEEMPASEAHRIGLVDEVAVPEEVLSSALARAHQISEASPTAIAGIMRLFAHPDRERDLQSMLSLEAKYQIELLEGEEFAKLQAAFLERRKKSTTSSARVAGGETK